MLQRVAGGQSFFFNVSGVCLFCLFVWVWFGLVWFVGWFVWFSFPAHLCMFVNRFVCASRRLLLLLLVVSKFCCPNTDRPTSQYNQSQRLIAISKETFYRPLARLGLRSEAKEKKRSKYDVTNTYITKQTSTNLI